MRAPCIRCGIMLHTGEGRVTVSFTAEDLMGLVLATPERSMRARLLCALGTIDPVREHIVREELAHLEEPLPPLPEEP